MNAELFPDFSLFGHDGNIYTNSSFAGQKAVFYFYPKDDTPGCTTEAKEFQELAHEFEDADIMVIGVSPDAKKSHCKFREKHDLEFLLLSDMEHLLVKALGIWKEKNMYGKTYWGVERTTYAVDEGGGILKTWNKVNPAGHAAEVLEFLKSLNSPPG